MNAISVGSFHLNVKDDKYGMAFPVLLHYPTCEISKPTTFGPYDMDVATDAPIAEGQYPLIIVSHGSGGSHLLYRTISLHLAKYGYIVASVSHFGNNRHDNSLENTDRNLQLRPQHISLAIDNILSDKRFGSHLNQEKIAVIGHSMGGYTALALAGGVPYTREGQKVQVQPDARIKALVLMAPGAGWFLNNLDKVNASILLLTAEHDTVTPEWNAEIIMNGVPDKQKVTYKQISNAGHFSFLSPFPVEMRKPQFLPSTDPEGFDRDAFHKQLPDMILAFLNGHL